ncbi:MAG: hypothetical protein ACLFOA_08230 [Desulfohalobiaceae bacterium]
MKDHLHSYLAKRLAGEFHARPDNNQEQLKERALEVAQERERAAEAKLVNQLLETHNSGGKAMLQPWR